MRGKGTSFCPYCGREVSPHFKFCPYCGRPLKRKPSSEVQPPPPPPPQSVSYTMPTTLPPPPPPEQMTSYTTPTTGEVVVYYKYIQPYYIYITNRRIAGVKSRKRAFLNNISPISAAVVAYREAIKSEQQQKLLYELNTKKKSFEFYWEQIRLIEAKKPGWLSGGHIKIYPIYGKYVKIYVYGSDFEEIVNILRQFVPDRLAIV